MNIKWSIFNENALDEGCPMSLNEYLFWDSSLILLHLFISTFLLSSPMIGESIGHKESVF